jgi:hypothetical protein
MGHSGLGLSSGVARDPNHEHRRQYEATLGPELGSVFAELWQEVAWLHTVWGEYRAIFADSPAQLDIANEAAGAFFYMMQKVLWEAVLLHLARLTDPAIRGRKQNLAIPALQKLVKPELHMEVSALTQLCIDATAFARDWRNRYIAHKDLPLALGDRTARPLQAASRRAVEDALSSLDELLNAIDRSYNDTTTMFAGIAPHTGAKRLLQVLHKGLSAEKVGRSNRLRLTGAQ